MGFNILDSNGKQIGWSADVFDNDSELRFIDDTQAIEPDINVLKSNKLADIKQAAQSMLASTDWQLQRAHERDSLGVSGADIDTPKQVLAKREAIRRASNRAESEIIALTDSNAVVTYVLGVLDTDYPDSKSLTHLEFLRRFTAVERVSIADASTQNAALADYMTMLNSAKLINLDDADVAGGVTMLEAAGVIAVGRASEILA